MFTVLVVAAALAPAADAAVPSNTVLPKVTGTARDGQTLTSTTGTWSGSPTSYARQWMRCNGASCVGIPAATTTTYVLTADDVSRRISVRITASNASGAKQATSAQTTVVAAAPPTNTALPVISASVTIGETLSSTTGGWKGTAPLSFSRQWRRCDGAGANCSSIAGATDASYVLASTDVGSTIRLVVTATNAAGSASATSAQTPVVAAEPPAGAATEQVTYGVGASDGENGGSWATRATASGAVLQVYESTRVPTATISPDMQSMVWVHDSNPNEVDKVRLTGMDGSGRIDLFVNPWENQLNPTFGPDLEWVYFEQGVYGHGSTLAIWRAPVAGGAAEPFITSAVAQHDLSFSADGQKTLWLVGPGGETDQTLTLGTATGQNAVEVPKPAALAGGILNAKLSPNGTQIAVVASATKNSSGQPSKRDLYVMSTSGMNLRRLTSTTTQDEGSPSWSPDGTRIMFEVHGSADGTSAVRSVLAADGTGLLTVATPSPHREYFRPAYRQARTMGNFTDLVERYKPTLAYDSDEVYYADAADTIVDAPMNKLHRNNVTLAAHNQPGIPELSLGFLGSYGGLADDRLDETDENPEPQEVAQSAHGVDMYRDVAYARPTRDNSGKWWIQYWLWYYYNDVLSEPTFTGNHEGDWEMVQVGFSATGVPDTVTFAQHAQGMRCSWDEADHDPVAGGVPALMIYPASGTHATYPKPGVWGPSSGHPVADYARGDDPDRVRPRLVTISDTAPSWVTWPGHWGNSGSSPQDPKQQGKWNAGPWSAGMNPCDTDPQAGARIGARAASARAPRRLAKAVAVRERPRQPVLRAQRTGGRIGLSIRPRTRGAHTSAFLVRITSATGQRIVRTVSAAKRVTRARIALPSRIGPYRVSVSAVSRLGLRSHPARRAVR